MNPHKILTAVGVAGMAYMAVAMSYGPSTGPAAPAVIAQAAVVSPGDAADSTMAEQHGPMPKWVRDMIVVAIRGTGL
ncbi:hypothetical protein CAL26_23485 [Bordetella genomosp. 9]|uniref:Uncharacterized protein n=1 Tax=Bordetella genomosp. 9 TaxID=1416803 RepID=A0A261R7V9_9BORD|nr:hypothetical protein [Bordetella genomosp. 9]OZI20463.1 hypothetical protein CAL26_23485 [Bordetella genomosp. 9]